MKNDLKPGQMNKKGMSNHLAIDMFSSFHDLIYHL